MPPRYPRCPLRSYATFLRPPYAVSAKVAEHCPLWPTCSRVCAYVFAMPFATARFGTEGRRAGTGAERYRAAGLCSVDQQRYLQPGRLLRAPYALSSTDAV
eukprot:2195497-Rhodomonas_salina.1